MLIDFSVSNFASFKDRVTLSMEKTPIQKHPEHILDNKLLSGVCVYGANASGKTNLLHAIRLLGQFTLPQSVLIMKDRNSFMMDSKYPTEFEVNFISENIKYNYKIAISSTEVVNEELYFEELNKKNLVFKRHGVKKEFGKLFKDDWYKNRSFPKDITLLSKFLSDGIVDNPVENKQHILSAINFLRGIVYFEPRTEINPAAIYNNFNFPKFKKFILDLLRQADFGITDIAFKPVDASNKLLSANHIMQLSTNPGMVICSQQNDDYFFFTMEKEKFKCHQLVIHHNDAILNMGLESAGTIKLFKLGFTLHYFKNIKGSKLLLLDEFDSLFHPFLSKILLKSLLNNPMGGQIIVALHNTMLLSHEIWRVDEIWFTEKDEDGVSRLYPLTDINPRFDKDLEKDYINGRYGAIPFLGGEKAWEEIIK